MVDPYMPGVRPAQILEQLFNLALACIRTDDPSCRPKVGARADAQRDHSTVLARVEAVQQHWPQP